ncbi:Translocation protein SEC62 [Verticillium dahliae VDG1]|nr:Translocation protein SEC62 [Verticillium dahliae VDG1]
MQLRPGALTLRNSHQASRSLLISTCAIRPRCSPAVDPRFPSHFASYHNTPRRSSAWGAAVQVAGHMASNAINRVTKGDMHIDPLRTVAKEMKFLTGNIRNLLGSGHPALEKVAKYYTHAEGKHIRPLVVLLMARATALCPKAERRAPTQTYAGINSPISPDGILSDVNPTSPFTGPPLDPQQSNSDILPSQRRLAEITELIHTSSLLHDDNLGLAFQLVDDMLDYTRSEKDLGKPAGADLELGLATAPLLYAWKANPELGALVGRKFEGEGDVARARELVLQSNGIEQTRALAQETASSRWP